MSRRIIAVFEREEDILGAARAARQNGLAIADAYSPYAVHGLERAIGLAPSRLPYVCYLAGLLGVVSILSFQFWASAVSWPINVGGKPWNSLPAFIPATFEVLVLCAGLGTVAAFIWIAGLRPGRQATTPDALVTDNRFALVFVPSGPGSDRAAVEAVLARFHPVRIAEVQEAA